MTWGRDTLACELKAGASHAIPLEGLEWGRRCSWPARDRPTFEAWEVGVIMMADKWVTVSPLVWNDGTYCKKHISCCEPPHTQRVYTTEANATCKVSISCLGILGFVPNKCPGLVRLCTCPNFGEYSVF